MKPGDYIGFTPDTTRVDAIAAYMAKYPDADRDILEIHRDDGCVGVRRRQDGRGAQHELDRHGTGNYPGDSVSTEGEVR